MFHASCFMRIHFIGIGGIGVSALAQYYSAKGHDISGSDLVASEITDFLAKKGMKIFIGNDPENIKKDFNLVIHSPAVKPDNLEYKKAKELGIVLKSYPEALGELTREYITIAVSGSHGKSTTTAMVALVLIKAGIDPTVVVGTKLKEFGGSNFRMGKSNYLVIEACEYDSSFINYSPKIIVVTNVDKEHLDYFKTFKNVINTFRDFTLKLPEDGFLVFNKDDKHIPIVNLPQFKLIGYSLEGPSFQLEGPIGRTGLPILPIEGKDAKHIKKILKIPGQHNVYNALAALLVARILGVKDSIAFKSLSEYKGSWRRFEIKEILLGNPPSHKATARRRKITIVSDYGHHPNEILATLKAAREKYPTKKIWCVFQPHQYQRTYYLFSDFVKVFKKVPIDNIIITDIYDVAGREEQKINVKISSEKLVKRIAKKSVRYMATNEAEKFVKEHIDNGDVLIIMGAGDIYKLVDTF